MMRTVLFCMALVCSGHLMAQRIIPGRVACIGFTGDTTDVITPTRGGVALIGGGGDVPGAFKWMIDRSGGGNVVVLRASGDYMYNETINSLGKVHSIETLLIDSREMANRPEVARVIRNAEMLFIVGGDQSNYMNFWRNTKTSEAINYLLNVKKVPVGGTSAGCAVLTGMYYSGEGGSATSAILENPYDSIVKLYNNDFLEPPYLRNVLSDMHFRARHRQGRHVAFLSRIIKDWKIFPKGIAMDEKTAVCVDEKGNAVVFGAGNAYFLLTDPARAPERCLPRQPLNWNGNGKAIRVYEIQGSEGGNGFFPVSDFAADKAVGGRWWWWSVEDGELRQQQEEKYVIVIHGGAGTILKKNMTPGKEAAYRAGLRKALETGYAILKKGGSSIDVVEATVKVLEDDSLFNAGRGAVFTHDGINELDASIMNGKDLSAGAVAGVRNIRNPITAARAVMEKSEHVLLTGRGAEQFAKEAGVIQTDPSWFRTQQRWNELQEALKDDSLKAAAGHTLLPDGRLGIINR